MRTRTGVLAALTILVPLSAGAALPPCGMPTGGGAPRASDALQALRTAVQVGECDIRVCDVSDTNTVTASDALMILKSAVGQEVRFNCPGSI